MTEKIIFKNYPLPPSVNSIYKHFVQKGRARRVPTQLLKNYKAECEKWNFINCGTVQKARVFLNVEKHIKVECYVCISTKRRAGAFKRMDVANRAKALLDALVVTLDIDDRFYINIVLEKIAVESGSDEKVVIVLSKTQQRDHDKLMADLIE